MSLFNSLLPLSGPLPEDHVRRSIPSGKTGTATTIREMQRFVEKNKRNGRIKEYLYAMIGGCPQKDYACYARSMYDWVVANTRYIWDPNQVEMLQDPFFILSKTRVGDCDDLSTLMATLYEFIDLPARFVTVKADMSAPNEYSHVFTEVKVPGRGWMGADVTQPQHGFGWVPPEKYPRRTWPATTERQRDPQDDKLGGLSHMRDYANTRQRQVPPPNRSPFLGEINVPGVTFIPAYSGPAGDYRRYVSVRALGAMDVVDPVLDQRQATLIEDAPLEVLQKYPSMVANLTPAQADKVAGRINAAAATGDPIKKAAVVGGVAFLAYLLLKSLGGKR